MARKLCPFLLILVLFLTCSCTTTGGINGYVVEIICDDGLNEAVGTGFLLEGGYILTAAHIFSGAHDGGAVCTVKTFNGGEYETDIICLDVDNDLALLRSKSEDGLHLAATFPDEGSRAVIVSVESEITATVTGARSCEAPDKPPLLIQLATYLPKGMSGAPVVDKKGTVTGIICARSLDGVFAYAVPVSVIREFLKNA